MWRGSSTRRVALRLAILAGLASACGSSSSRDEGGDGASGDSGSSGASNGGASNGGSSRGGTSNGGASGTSTTGGASGTMTGGSNATGGAASGAGGNAGSGATAGSAGAPPGGDWTDACGGVSMNGRCVGNVYQWCDFFGRSVAALDCGALGMRCEATPTQFHEDELNGCVGDPCTSGTRSCDGAMLYDCLQGEMHARDCRKHRGATSLCTDDGTGVGCTSMTCDPSSGARCEGSMLVGCNEDGELRVEDCKRCDPAGQCVFDPNDIEFRGASCSAPTMGCAPI